MIVSLVLSLLVVMWVKMQLNNFAYQLAGKDTGSTDESVPPKKPEPKQAAPQPQQQPQPQPQPQPQRDPEVMKQPPPTQIRPEIPWQMNMPPPMPVAATLFHVEPDPVAADDLNDPRAFENAE